MPSLKSGIVAMASLINNDLLARVNKRMVVDHRLTTPYYPQANGQVERLNRVLVDSLSMYCTEHLATWDEFLPSVLFSYRTSVHAVTGFTPFALMHGREARLPLDVMEGTKEDLIDDYQLYKTRLTLTLREANEAVKEAIKSSAILQKESWDDKVNKTTVLKVNDKVLMYLPSPKVARTAPEHAAKFASHWTGPLTVIESQYHNVYKVRDDITKRTFTANISNLQPFTGSQFLVAQDDEGQTPDSLINEQEEDLPKPVEPDPLIHTPTLSPNQSPRERSKRRPESKLEQKRQKKRTNAKYKDEYLQELESYGEYEVEEIINHRKLGNGRYNYLVKWKNASSPSWVAAKDIYTVDCLKDYWRSSNSSPNEVPRKFRKYINLPIKRLQLKLGTQ